MNVLHLRSSAGFFGAEGVILNLAKQLTLLGVNNSIVCIKNRKNPHADLVKNARREGLHAECVNCAGRLDIKTIQSIRIIIKKYHIDVLHCHDYKANLFGLLACVGIKTKIIATNHLWTSETWTLRFYEFLDGIVLNWFDRVVAVSDQVANEVSRLLLSKRKLVTIYNGIDLKQFNPELGPPSNAFKKEFNLNGKYKIVGSIGRLSVQKGFVYLLEAAKKVIESNPNVVFMIIGDGVLRESLIEKTRTLGIQNNVIFTGVRKDMTKIYNGMDIFVMASIKEGLPLVLLEALAMKKPIIATNVGGIPSVIQHGKTGILTKPADTDELAHAILVLLSNKSLADTLAANGRTFVEDHFSAGVMAMEYKRLYERVLS